MLKVPIILLLLLFINTSIMAQEFTMPSSSPMVEIKQQFSTSKIKLEYSRPSMRGRKIFGELIPFGQPWRTGANKVAKVIFDDDIIFGGKEVPAGAYALYCIPDKNKWTVILNSNSESFGLEGIEPQNDIVRIEVKPEILQQDIETLTIEITNLTKISGVLNILWENTKIGISLISDNQSKVLSYLERELNSANPPYLKASYFYYEIDQYLEKALEFANIVIGQKPDSYWVYTHKARILKKLGRKSEALEAAIKGAELSKGTIYEYEYTNVVNEFR